MLKECNICFINSENIWQCNNKNCTAIVCQDCHVAYKIICLRSGCPYCNPLEKKKYADNYDNEIEYFDDEIEYFDDDFDIFGLDLDFEIEFDNILGFNNQFYQIIYVACFCSVFAIWFFISINIYIFFGNLLFSLFVYIFNLAKIMPSEIYQYITRGVIGFISLKFWDF